MFCNELTFLFPYIIIGLFPFCKFKSKSENEWDDLKLAEKVKQEEAKIDEKKESHQTAWSAIKTVLQRIFDEAKRYKLRRFHEFDEST